jgi:hypothetical protein
MKRFNYFLLLLFVSIGFFGCSRTEEEELTADVNERIVGQWTVDSQTLFEVTVPGDGSYLTFDGCDGDNCTGVDYMASDQTSGTFSYSFAEDNSTITIVDNDPEAGGNYSGEWTIEEFTNNKLVIWIDTALFGITEITFTK